MKRFFISWLQYFLLYLCIVYLVIKIGEHLIDYSKQTKPESINSK